jgi:flagellar biogenesis protein FliO
MATSNVQLGGFAGWAVSAIQRRRASVVSRRSEKQLELVETLSLGGRRQVALIACGGQQFLVGMGADSITSLIAVAEGDVKKLVEADEVVPPRYVRWEGGL